MQNTQASAVIGHKIAAFPSPFAKLIFAEIFWAYLKQWLQSVKCIAQISV